MPDVLSPTEIGQNLRALRELRGLSQSQTAALARISERTLRRLEQGIHLKTRTLEQVTVALGWNATEARTSRRYLEPKSPAEWFRLHRPEETYWYITDDRRKQVPPDDLKRIQDPLERHRLGHLGLVDMFVGTMGFRIPDGPGIAFFEIYGAVAFGGGSYRDLFLYALRGEVVATLDGQDVVIPTGGGLHVQRQPIPLRPARPIGPRDEAPLLMHVGTGLIRGAPEPSAR